MSNKMLLCGNGFSMNFDSSFGNIMDRLYEAHLLLKRDGEYTINSNVPNFKKKALENYNEVMGYLRNISKDDLYQLFEKAMKFGEYIVDHKELFDYCKEKGKITELIFGVNEWTILESLISDWKEFGLNKINIEYITILIHFYYSLGEEKIKECNLEYNEFVRVLRIGGRNNYLITDGDNDFGHNIYNGFTTYYRMLFSIAIFNSGKAISLDNLDKINSLDKNGIIDWLRGFKVISTLNYDHLLELLVPDKKVIHLHGEFELVDEKMFCNYQSLRMKFNNSFVSFSDILIGDYIYNKTNRGMVNVLASKGKFKTFNNKPLAHTFKVLEEEISKNKIKEIDIFGLNINNDQHIIRNIVTGLYWAGIKQPVIRYHYFDNKEKETFKETYEKCLVFGDKIVDYAKKNIKLEFVPTQETLKNNFHKIDCLV